MEEDAGRRRARHGGYVEERERVQVVRGRGRGREWSERGRREGETVDDGGQGAREASESECIQLRTPGLDLAQTTSYLDTCTSS